MTEYELTQHYVEFLSPGTIFSETTTKEIPSWDVEAAVEMSHSVLQRHGARPYGFRFLTRGRKWGELDAEEIADSPIYWLGGTIETAEEILARNEPSEEMMRFNIRSSGAKRIITNTNSWKFTSELKDDQVVLDYSPRPHSEIKP